MTDRVGAGGIAYSNSLISVIGFHLLLKLFSLWALPDEGQIKWRKSGCFSSLKNCFYKLCDQIKCKNIMDEFWIRYFLGSKTVC